MTTPSLRKYIKKIPWRTVILLSLLLASLYLFAEIVEDVLWDEEDQLDNAVFEFLEGFASPGLTKFFVFISLLGSSAFLLPAYALLGAWFIMRKQAPVALHAAIIGITGTVMVRLLKLIFQRERPDNPLGEAVLTHSFPSGHTTTGFIFFGLLIYLAWKQNPGAKYRYLLSGFLLLLSILVGISRIYLRKHYASDVVAGFCLGYAWLFITLWILEKVERTDIRR